jgi:hypothetical protein
MSRLLFQMHIMWYESKMINETLDSLQTAIKHSPIPVDIKLCFNSQTYVEVPEYDAPEDMFDSFKHHSLLKDVDITYKSNADPFYNIGDWRRDVYDGSYRYTIWGESDCLIPHDYFYILSELNIEEPHVVSLASRKMGDNTWAPVEYTGMEKYNRSWPERNDSIPYPFFARDRITYEELCNINDADEVIIVRNDFPKIDGALLALSPNLPKYIPDDFHFVPDDFCANLSFIHHSIPQYIIKNVMKGHNYAHPLKRTNTKSTRSDELYKQYEQESHAAMKRFITSLRKN